MERLTDNYDYCFLTCYEQEGDLYGEECPWYKNCHERQMFEKLKHYEDLEEQGRLIELPCKVGDTVYVVDDDYEDIYDLSSQYYFIIECKFELYMITGLGTWVFITKEEAEAKLARLKEGVE